MSFQQPKILRPNRVRILNIPETFSKDDLINFAKDRQGFKKADIKKSDDGKTVGLIWFETPDIAERMAKELDGMTIEPHGSIQAVLDQPPPNGGKRGTRNRGGSAGRTNSGPYDGQPGANGGYWAGGSNPTSSNYYGGGGGYFGAQYPIVNSPAFQTVLRNHARGIRFIRMLVPRMHVGLVIGHNGATIKEITQKSRARIDVRHEFFNRPPHPLRMGNNMVLCQVIYISGHDDECVSAIREMYGLLLKHLEANPNSDAGESDSWLWLLAEDRHCGRLIGIAGKHFNTIKEKTSAQVIVGNAPQMVFNQENLEPFFGGPERSVAIRAEGGDALKAVGEACLLLLEKLTACRELDIKFASSNTPADESYQHSAFAGVLHGGSAYSGGQMPRGGGAVNGAAMGAMPYTPQVTHSPGVSEFEFDQTLYMRIPHTSAGAVIGHEGVTVRKIIADSGAHVFIAKPEDKKSESNGPIANGSSDDKTRHVTIHGTPEAISKAQFLIFDRVKMVAQQAGRGSAGDEVAGDPNAQPSLTTLIRVPKTMLGRLVGRGGTSIRETQNYSGATLKLPKLQKQNGGGGNGGDEKQGEAAERDKSDGLETVEIYGTYIATQKCLDCVRNLLYAANTGPAAYASGGGFRGNASQGYYAGAGGGVEQLTNSLQSLNLMSPAGGYGGSNAMAPFSPGYASAPNPAYAMGGVGGGMYAQYGYGYNYGQLSFPEYGGANVGPQRYPSGGGPMGKPSHGGRGASMASSGGNKKFTKAK